LDPKGFIVGVLIQGRCDANGQAISRVIVENNVQVDKVRLLSTACIAGRLRVAMHVAPSENAIDVPADQQACQAQKYILGCVACQDV